MSVSWGGGGWGGSTRLPLSIVEGEGFARLMEIVSPGDKVHVARFRIEQRYAL